MLKPDAFVRVEAGDYEQVTFLEIDRATEHLPAIRRKLQTYAQAFAAGVEQAGGAAFPNVLFVVPDEPRQKAIEREIGRLPPPHSQLFTVFTTEQSLNHLKGGES